EAPSNPCDDIRNAFELLISSAVIADYEIFPFLALLEGGFTSHEVIGKLLRRLTLFVPNVILWVHTRGLHVSKDYLTLVRRNCDNAIFAYWDGDIYEKPYKKLPEEVV